MPFDRRVPPYRLSPASWTSGHDDIDLLIDLHEGDDGTPEQEKRRERRDSTFETLAHMSDVELRAYIDEMHCRLAEYFW